MFVVNTKLLFGGSSWLKKYLLEHSYCSFSGFFPEVFRGIWNGTDVAIKVFLEQDLTPENMEDFCNEISIFGGILLLRNCFSTFFFCYIYTFSDYFLTELVFLFTYDILMVFSNILIVYFFYCCDFSSFPWTVNCLEMVMVINGINLNSYLLLFQLIFKIILVKYSLLKKNDNNIVHTWL